MSDLRVAAIAALCLGALTLPAWAGNVLPEWETTSKLRYAPPTLVAPIVIDAPDGFAKIEIGADDDAIVKLSPTKTRTRKLTTDGGRNVRIIGGDCGASDFQPMHMSRSLFVEGLKFDFARGLPVVNGCPVDLTGKQIHDAMHVVGVAPGTAEPPEVYVQNCYIGGTHGTNRAHSDPVELQSITATGGAFQVITKAAHNLKEGQNFICGPTSDHSLDYVYTVTSVVSPTEVKAIFRKNGANLKVPDGTTGTGGYLWGQLSKTGLHADGYQTNDNSIEGTVHFYRTTFDVGYQGFIGGHAAGDKQARGLEMCRVNIRANNVFPHDDRSMLLYLGDTDQSGSGDPNKGRKQPFPITFDRVYLKPRPGLSLTGMVAPGPEATRSKVPVGVRSDDGGKTAYWPDPIGIKGFITLSPDGYGENGRDYADLDGPNAPGLNYRSPGYSSDSLQPLVMSEIVAADPAAKPNGDATASDVVARLDVKFTGAGHIIDLKLTDDAGGHFALRGRDLIRTGAAPAGPQTVTVQASEQGNAANAISQKIPVKAQ